MSIDGLMICQVARFSCCDSTVLSANVSRYYDTVVICVEKGDRHASPHSMLPSSIVTAGAASAAHGLYQSSSSNTGVSGSTPLACLLLGVDPPSLDAFSAARVSCTYFSINWSMFGWYF